MKLECAFFRNLSFWESYCMYPKIKLVFTTKILSQILWEFLQHMLWNKNVLEIAYQEFFFRQKTIYCDMVVMNSRSCTSYLQCAEWKIRKWDVSSKFWYFVTQLSHVAKMKDEAFWYCLTANNVKCVWMQDRLNEID